MTPEDLTALVSSRICHDLISPIGAISNGVELLSGFGQEPSPELGLIGDSAAIAAAKLRYFRIAFGAAKPGALIRTGEVRELLAAMFSSRFRTVSELPGNDLPRDAVKCILLSVLCLEKSMPLGGEATISEVGETFVLTATGPRMKPDTALWALASGRAATREVIPAEVQFAILGMALKEARAALETMFEDTTCRITLKGLV